MSETATKFEVGEVVWVQQQPWGMSAGYAKRQTVTKIGKRDLVLDDGSRWQVDGGMRRCDRRDFNADRRVYKLDDPAAEAGRVKIKAAHDKVHAAQLRSQITATLTCVHSMAVLQTILATAVQHADISSE